MPKLSEIEQLTRENNALRDENTKLGHEKRAFMDLAAEFMSKLWPSPWKKVAAGKSGPQSASRWTPFHVCFIELEILVYLKSNPAATREKALAAIYRKYYAKSAPGFKALRNV